MKKLISLFLAIMMLTSFCTAFAEGEISYFPGVPTRTLIQTAVANGKVLRVHFTPIADVDLSGFISEAELPSYNALLSVLRNIDISVAAGAPAPGLFLSAQASYQPDDGADIVIDGGILAGEEGINVMSSGLPGKKVTIAWETILDKLGISESRKDTIIAILQNRYDFEALREKMLQKLQTLAEYLLPYVTDAASWAAELKMDTNENVAAEGPLPSAEQQLSLTVQDKEVAVLLSKWVDRFAEDANLLPLFKQYLQADTDELISKARTGIETLQASEGSCTVKVGISSEPVSGYISVARYDAQEQDMVFIGTIEQKADTTFYLTANVLDDTNEPAASGEFTFSINPEDFNEFSFDMDFAVLGDPQPYHMAYSLSRSAAQTEDGFPAYTMEIQENVSAHDEDSSATVIVDASGFNALNAEGGEDSQVSGSYDLTADDMAFHIDFFADESTVPDAEYGFMNSGSFYITMPDYGIQQAGMHQRNQGEDFDLDAYEALEPIAFESLTEESLTALQNEVQNNAMSFVTNLISALPSEVLALFSENAQ